MDRLHVSTVALALLLAAGCQQPASQEGGSAPTPPNPTAAAPAPVAGSGGAVASGDPTPAAATAKTPKAPPSPADRALVELKAKARTLLAADRTAIKNQHGYDQAVTRHRRDMAAVGFEERLPLAPLRKGQVEVALVEHLIHHGLTLVQARLGPPEPAEPVPAEHAGRGPYKYATDQIVERTPVVLTVSPAKLAPLEGFFKDVCHRASVMLDLVAVTLSADGKATFTGYAYARRAVTPPKHTTRTPTLAELAVAAGVELPTGHARLSEVEALLDEHRALHTALAGSMKSLGEAHLLGAWFQFYRGRVQDLGARKFPEPMRAAPE